MDDNRTLTPASENEAGEVKPVPTIEPTVGRMVYYKSYGTPGGEYPSVDRVATITEVTGCDENGVYSVGLCVFNPEGLFFNRNVKQGNKPGNWDWMPFQKDQQARLAKEE